MWNVVDSGVQSGDTNMRIDRDALAAMVAQTTEAPLLRFFQWDRPTVTYGYLLNEEEARRWTPGHPTVKRPTGGGAVLHTETDLSFSLLWPRESNHFSSAPRKCYAEIHTIVKNALHPLLKRTSSPFRERLGEGQVMTAIQTGPHPTLSLKGEGSSPSCNTQANRFSVCFQEPVCNDVMLDGRKVVGGALRVTRQAMLYQGTIQLGNELNVGTVKKNLEGAFNHGK